jgi:TolB-like protein/DNA-binding winged helix-turn-helix (wHTH) protein
MHMDVSQHPVRVGAFELDRPARELRDGTSRVRLQRQPFEILCALLERPGTVITRDELRKRLWRDDLFVDFEHSLNAAVKRLRTALGDDAVRPTLIETVPRCGYRYIGVTHAPQRASRLRLVVLPFTTLSSGIWCEYFSEGVTEELIVQLGAVSRSIEIIAPRSSRFEPRDQRRARDIGTSLQAGFLLEGSTRHDGDRVRITARLVDTCTEVHVWSETYDRLIASPMTVQADVGTSVARAVVKELPALNSRIGR